MSKRSPITSHVLDVSLGKPAEGIRIILEKQSGPEWSRLGEGSTNLDGRVENLLPEDHPLEVGVYRLNFETQAYFSKTGQQGFYPEVWIYFEVQHTAEHYHVPLLLSPFGYSTYRGS